MFSSHLAIDLLFFLMAVVFGEDVFRFANHYESNMVLQRQPYRAVVWGYGEPGQNVQLRIEPDDKIYETIVKSDKGVWKIVLDPTAAGGPFDVKATSFVSGKETVISVENILFGDVWLCGGQSNMGFSVSMSFKEKEEISLSSNYPNVRLFTVKKYVSEIPVEEIDSRNIEQHWSVASSESVGGKPWSYFSALCWMYGRRLYDLYSVPIGLITSRYGGTCVEAWSSHDALYKCNISNIEERLDRKQKATIKRNAYKKDYSVILKDENTPSFLWNTMIHPFINTTIYGVIWYQGERNAVLRPTLYHCTFPALIDDWRFKWYEGTNGSTNLMFPFGFVQLASLGSDAIRSNFPVVRWEQTAKYGYVPNEKQKNVFMAVAMDLPDDTSPYGSIHPRDKTTIAERLILGARATAYNESLVYFQGPILDSCILIQVYNVIRLTYRNVGENGIVMKSMKGFEVQFSNMSWISTNAVYNDKQFIYFGNFKEEPIAIRYSWHQRPCDYKKCAVYSTESDLPAGPFVCNLMRTTDDALCTVSPAVLKCRE